MRVAKTNKNREKPIRPWNTYRQFHLWTWKCIENVLFRYNWFALYIHMTIRYTYLFIYLPSIPRPVVRFPVLFFLSCLPHCLTCLFVEYMSLTETASGFILSRSLWSALHWIKITQLMKNNSKLGNQHAWPKNLGAVTLYTCLRPSTAAIMSRLAVIHDVSYRTQLVQNMRTFLSLRQRGTYLALKWKKGSSSTGLGAGHRRLTNDASNSN